MPGEIQPTHDVVVIGAGSTGENVADYAHQGGLSWPWSRRTWWAGTAPTGPACRARRCCVPPSPYRPPGPWTAPARPWPATWMSPPC